MSFRVLFGSFAAKLRSTRPFLRTKIGSRLALLVILDFIVLFFAPAIHGFVGAALFGCAASVFLVLLWRHYDRRSAIVPALFLCVPLTLDMLIYAIANAGNTDTITGIITALLVAIAGVMLAAKNVIFGFMNKITDTMYLYVAAGAASVAVVVAAWLLNLMVMLSVWILYVVAFLIVVLIFLRLVYSTATYTATDGRRQAHKRRAQEAQQRRYAEYRPRSRDTEIYNVDDEDEEEEEPNADEDIDFFDFG